jgi:hypothetical protein
MAAPPKMERGQRYPDVKPFLHFSRIIFATFTTG